MVTAGIVTMVTAGIVTMVTAGIVTMVTAGIVTMVTVGIVTMDTAGIVDWGGFGQLRNFCNFWTRKLSLNSSYGLGILRQPFRTMSCRKCGSKINVGMSGFF